MTLSDIEKMSVLGRVELAITLADDKTRNEFWIVVGMISAQLLDTPLFKQYMDLWNEAYRREPSLEVCIEQLQSLRKILIIKEMAKDVT